MFDAKYDEKLFSGFFHFENLVEYSNKTVFFYDIWFTSGNLTDTQFEIFSSLNTTEKTDSVEGSWVSNDGFKFEDIEDDLNGFARIMKY